MLFVAVSALVAFVWGCVGVVTAVRGTGQRLAIFQKLAAVWLMSVAGWLALTAICI